MRRKRKAKFARRFHISKRPVISSTNKRKKSDELGEIGILHAGGTPMLFAVARDPRTIFVSWSIDWSTIFARTTPVDRRVHVRVHRADGSEDKSVAVEPMVDYCYVDVSRPATSYHVEIGYYQPADVWNSIAISDDVPMPSGKVAETADVDLATIPFHLRFQQLLDLFGASGGDALAKIISRFQSQALRSNERHQLKPGAGKILRAMGISPRDLGSIRQAFLEQSNSEIFRQRVEALLSFFGSSPSRGFGGGDRTSGGS